MLGPKCLSCLSKHGNQLLLLGAYNVIFDRCQNKPVCLICQSRMFANSIARRSLLTRVKFVNRMVTIVNLCISDFQD
jgi:hypothetical protein